MMHSSLSNELQAKDEMVCRTIINTEVSEDRNFLELRS